MNTHQAYCIVTLAVLIAAPFPCRAATLDQRVEILSPNNSIAVIPTQTLAQTFRAGISGRLAHIDLQASRRESPTATLVVELRSTLANGFPDQSLTGLLASAELSPAEVPFHPHVGDTWLTVDFSTEVQLTADMLYAILLSSETDLESANWYLWTFSYLSSNPTPYFQGRAYVDGEFSPMSELMDPGQAFGFRTFMVPEPGTLLLIAFGLVCFVKIRQLP